MTLTVTIPTFRTDRLILRAPQVEDLPAFAIFVASDRARFVGGPVTDMQVARRAWGHLAGVWVLRGYGSFTACLHDGTPIGSMGPWFPATWPEPEFGWTLWSADYEGQGYVTEAMTLLRDWTFETTSLTTLVSYIEPDNHASARVAQRLGGIIDPDATPPDADPVLIFRYRKVSA